MNSVLAALGISLVSFLLQQILVRVYRAVGPWVRARRQTTPPAGAVPAVRIAPARPQDLHMPPDLGVAEKVAWLEAELEDASRAAREARARDADDGAAAARAAAIERCLEAMAFLEPEDVLDGRYRLLRYVGRGRLAVVWRAYDLERDRAVAVKLLRHSFIRDESVVRQFRYSARIMAELNAASFTAVLQDVRELAVDGRRRVAYYVLEFVEGTPLEEYPLRGERRREQVLDGLIEVGHGLARAHAAGVVHRDIKPSNIVVQPDGHLKLVDFDAVLRLGDRQVAHREMGTFGYSAPEVLNGTSDPDAQADIFALGRVFAFLYYGRPLPDSYHRSVDQVVDLLNCAPVVKRTLKRASSVSRKTRYASMTEFLADMEVAVGENRRKLPFWETAREEQEKIGRLLRHSFVGTLALMMFARPLIGAVQMAQLSDTPWVAGFHGIIGSLLWGTFIPGAFLLYLISVKPTAERRTGRQLAAMAACGVGGFTGGVLAAVPSVLVTNQDTLTCLGWLTPGAEDRLYSALVETRMFLAYPLTGLLTGCGVGLCLERGIRMALEVDPGGTGVLPVPHKEDLRAAGGGRQLAARLLRSPQAHAYLMFPFLFAFLVVAVLNPYLAPVAECGPAVVPRETWRTLGEGVIHYFGGIGLVAGFFLGVRPEGSRRADEPLPEDADGSPPVGSPPPEGGGVPAGEPAGEAEPASAAGVS